MLGKLHYNNREEQLACMKKMKPIKVYLEGREGTLRTMGFPLDSREVAVPSGTKVRKLYDNFIKDVHTAMFSGRMRFIFHGEGNGTYIAGRMATDVSPYLYTLSCVDAVIAIERLEEARRQEQHKGNFSFSPAVTQSNFDFMTCDFLTLTGFENLEGLRDNKVSTLMSFINERVMCGVSKPTIVVSLGSKDGKPNMPNSVLTRLTAMDFVPVHIDSSVSGVRLNSKNIVNPFADL